MSVDDVEQLAGGIDGEVTHAAEGDAAVARGERVKCVKRSGKRDDERAAVHREMLGYGDIGRLFRCLLRRRRDVGIGGQPREKALRIRCMQLGHTSSRRRRILPMAAVISLSA